MTVSPRELRQQGEALIREANRVERQEREANEAQRRAWEAEAERRRAARFEARVQYWRSGILLEPPIKKAESAPREPAWIRETKWPICERCGRGRLVPDNSTGNREEPPWGRTVFLVCTHCHWPGKATYNPSTGKWVAELYPQEPEQGE